MHIEYVRFAPTSIMRSLLAPAALTSFVGMTACGAKPEATPEPAVRPAVLIDVGAKAPARSLELPAIIDAAESADITFQVGGVLEDLPVKAGDEVAEGDMIGRLNQRDFINTVDQASAEFKIAESQFRRAEQLIGDALISQADYEELETRMNIARATLDSAEKALEDTTLRSPFSGVVASVDIDQFQNVSPSTPIVTIQTIGVAEAIVQAPSRLVAQSGQLQPSQVNVFLDAAPDMALPATLYSTNTLADATTQTFEASFRFTPPDDLVILPGMTGTVRATFRLESESGGTDQISIPMSAILSEADQQYVWKVDTDTMTVAKQPVSLLPGTGQSLVVQSGLSSGDTIVGAGASYLFEGMKIRRFED